VGLTSAEDRVQPTVQVQPDRRSSDRVEVPLIGRRARLQPHRQLSPKDRIEKIRGNIALLLFGLLAAIVLGSFGLMWVRPISMLGGLKDWLTIVLAPVVGLFGAASAFYYRDREWERILEESRGSELKTSDLKPD
jgi:hypothetical protein